MGTWQFAVAFGAQLVALIASPTDASSDASGLVRVIPVQFGLPPLAACLQVIWVERLGIRGEDGRQLLRLGGDLRGDHVGSMGKVVVVGVAVVRLWGNAGEHLGGDSGGQPLS